jgi:microcompartment protein CcmL/EutN
MMEQIVAARGLRHGEPAIGLVETNSIGTGIDATDAMMKRAAIEVLFSRSVCPGKYTILITGEVSAVEEAVEAGITRAGGTLVDTLILPNAHPSIVPALRQVTPLVELRALGVLESFTIASLIVATDMAVKAASVDLIEIRMAMALGGKAFSTMTGDEAAVRTSVTVGADHLRSLGLLVSEIVIPNPRPELLPFLL